MNISAFVWLLLAVQLVKSESDVKVKDSLTSSKLEDLMAEYRGMDPPKEELFEPPTSVNEVMRNPFSMRMIQGSAEHPFNYQLNTSSILLFDSVQNFVEHVKSIKWVTNPRFRHPHLVYIPGVTISDLLEHIEDGFLIDQVGFLVHGPDGSIGLATSFMYTKEKCRTNQLVTINRFTNVQVGWENKNFYPEKYNNFHGCNLNVTEKGVINFFKDLLPALNANFSYVEVSKEAVVNVRDVDLIGGLVFFDGDKEFITSDTVTTSKLFYVVPPGEPYSQFEKMFLPFDEGTWILICLTFLLAIITVQLVKLFPMKVQNFVFGRNFRHPTLNIFDIFLNGGQRKVPGRNFSRYILALFTIWCLIFRTCYQSKTFEFLQADMRKPGPTSLEDLGYTEDTNNRYGFNIMAGNPTSPGKDVYVPTEYGKPMNRTKFAICPPFLSPEDFAAERMTIISEPANKAFTLSYTHEIYVILNNKLASGNPSFVIFDDKINRVAFFAVKLKKFCPFYQTFNQKIGFYISSGIPQLILDKGLKTKGRGTTWKDEEMEPRVLTLDDLQIGFVIYLVCLGISTLVFFLELLPKRVKRFVTKVILLNVVVAYFRNLFPSGTKLPQKRLVKVRLKPLKTKTKFIQVKPFSPPSNPRYRIDLSTSLWQRSERNQCQTGSASMPQCPAGSDSSFCSTREGGAEEFGSLETSIDGIFAPRPEVQTVRGTTSPWLLIEDGRGGMRMLDISDLDFENALDLDIHGQIIPNAKSSNQNLNVKELLPQCTTESASGFALVDIHAGSSTHEVGAIFGPRPELKNGKEVPWTRLGNSRDECI